MSLTSYQSVSFGVDRAGLSTVGYRLQDEAGGDVTARGTVGVVELGGGDYAAHVALADGFRGRIVWDTGGADPVTASAVIEPEEDGADAREALDAVARVEAELAALRAGAAAGVPVAEELGVVRAGVPEVDNCPVLTRLKAFLVNQGVAATLEHVWRDRRGNPVDLSGYLGPGDSDSASSSAPPAAPGSAVLRVKEVVASGTSPERNPLWQVDADPYLPGAGVLRAALPADLVERAGLYLLDFGLYDGAGRLVGTSGGLLSVERGLFARLDSTRHNALGPVTVQELRMEVYDSAAAENVLLQATEFGDDQIVHAVIAPIEYWNEQPPPTPPYTTRSFPYRGQWRRAAVAQLLITAAHNYRRNVLKHQAGGVAVMDKDKEREYLGEGVRLWAEFKEWVDAAKLTENMRNVTGSSISTYGRRAGL